jgi:hypothetical protein
MCWSCAPATDARTVFMALFMLLLAGWLAGLFDVD